GVVVVVTETLREKSYGENVLVDAARADGVAGARVRAGIGGLGTAAPDRAGSWHNRSGRRLVADGEIARRHRDESAHGRRCGGRGSTQYRDFRNQAVLA